MQRRLPIDPARANRHPSSPRAQAKDLPTSRPGAGAMDRLASSVAAIWLALACLSSPAHGADAPLSAEERAAVFRAAGLQPRDGAYRRAGCEMPLKTDAEVLRLAGKRAVLVYLGASRCLAGGENGNVGLFIEDEAGRWVDRLGFVPGVEVVVQEGSSVDMPDIGVANESGCMPVYRWDGNRYAPFSQRAIQPGGCQFRQ
jgi:hypothetical protein